MRKTYLFLLTINILVAIITSKVFLLTTNTLLNNDRWDSEKIKLEMGVMGAWNFFSQTQSLNGDRLNLGAWHGFQEIISKKDFQYDHFEFDVLIKNDAYLLTHLTINNDLKTTLKISNKPTENFCLVINQDGEFIKKNQLNNLKIKPNEWFHVYIKLTDSKAKIVINEQMINCDVPNPNSTKIGFKGGYNDTLIDNIYLKNNDEVVFQENFSNNKKLIPTAVPIFIFLTLIQIFLNKKKITIFNLIVINISLFISVVILYLYLLLFFNGNYPNPKSLFNNLKKQEQELSDDEVALISNEVMGKFKKDDHEKIMFIGSSQTWGAGASTYDKTFPIVFEQLLNNPTNESTAEADLSSQVLGISTSQKIEIINTGVSGTISSELLAEYQKEWIKLKPKTLFINLSSNDFTYGDFKENFKSNIESFIEINKQNNIKTILLIEANSIELDINNPLHEILAEIANDKNILLIDIDQYLKTKNGTGLIWWDFIHPTNYGHELIAKYILDTINNNTESISELTF